MEVFLIRAIFSSKALLVELSESVEFKSLPSGLHNVHEDLMYEGLVLRLPQH